jgi:hypothetical protein
MKQKQYSSTPEPSPGARKCSGELPRPSERPGRGAIASCVPGVFKTEEVAVSAPARRGYRLQTVTLRVSRGVLAGREQVVDALPGDGLVYLARMKRTPLRAGGSSCELTFAAHGGGYVGVHSVDGVRPTDSRPVTLAKNGSCELTVAVSDDPKVIAKLLKGGKTTAFKTITPPASLVKVA